MQCYVHCLLLIILLLYSSITQHTEYILFTKSIYKIVCITSQCTMGIKIIRL